MVVLFISSRDIYIKNKSRSLVHRLAIAKGKNIQVVDIFLLSIYVLPMRFRIGVIALKKQMLPFLSWKTISKMFS